MHRGLALHLAVISASLRNAHIGDQEGREGRWGDLTGEGTLGGRGGGGLEGDGEQGVRTRDHKHSPPIVVTMMLERWSKSGHSTKLYWQSERWYRLKTFSLM